MQLFDIRCKCLNKSILFYSRQAQIKKDAVRAKQREEELYDKKAEEATKHAEKLKQERERCLDRINGNLDLEFWKL